MVRGVVRRQSQPVRRRLFPDPEDWRRIRLQTGDSLRGPASALFTFGTSRGGSKYVPIRRSVPGDASD